MLTALRSSTCKSGNSFRAMSLAEYTEAQLHSQSHKKLVDEFALTVRQQTIQIHD